jgi:hypothetical protein
MNPTTETLRFTGGYAPLPVICSRSLSALMWFLYQRELKSADLPKFRLYRAAVFLPVRCCVM